MHFWLLYARAIFDRIMRAGRNNVNLFTTPGHGGKEHTGQEGRSLQPLAAGAGKVGEGEKFH